MVLEAYHTHTGLKYWTHCLPISIHIHACAPHPPKGGGVVMAVPMVLVCRSAVQSTPIGVLSAQNLLDFVGTGSALLPYREYVFVLKNEQLVHKSTL